MSSIQRTNSLPTLQRETLLPASEKKPDELVSELTEVWNAEKSGDLETACEKVDQLVAQLMKLNFPQRSSENDISETPSSKPAEDAMWGVDILGEIFSSRFKVLAGKFWTNAPLDEKLHGPKYRSIVPWDKEISLYIVSPNPKSSEWCRCFFSYYEYFLTSPYHIPKHLYFSLERIRDEGAEPYASKAASYLKYAAPIFQVANLSSEQEAVKFYSALEEYYLNEASGAIIYIERFLSATMKTYKTYCPEIALEVATTCNLHRLRSQKHQDWMSYNNPNRDDVLPCIDLLGDIYRANGCSPTLLHAICKYLNSGIWLKMLDGPDQHLNYFNNVTRFIFSLLKMEYLPENIECILTTLIHLLMGEEEYGLASSPRTVDACTAKTNAASRKCNHQIGAILFSAYHEIFHGPEEVAKNKTPETFIEYLKLNQTDTETIKLLKTELLQRWSSKLGIAKPVAKDLPAAPTKGCANSSLRVKLGRELTALAKTNPGTVNLVKEQVPKRCSGLLSIEEIRSKANANTAELKRTPIEEIEMELLEVIRREIYGEVDRVIAKHYGSILAFFRDTKDWERRCGMLSIFYQLMQRIDDSRELMSLLINIIGEHADKESWSYMLCLFPHISSNQARLIQQPVGQYVRALQQNFFLIEMFSVQFLHLSLVKDNAFDQKAFEYLIELSRPFPILHEKLCWLMWRAVHHLTEEDLRPQLMQLVDEHLNVIDAGCPCVVTGILGHLVNMLMARCEAPPPQGFMDRVNALNMRCLVTPHIFQFISGVNPIGIFAETAGLLREHGFVGKIQPYLTALLDGNHVAIARSRKIQQQLERFFPDEVAYIQEMTNGTDLCNEYTQPEIAFYEKDIQEQLEKLGNLEAFVSDAEDIVERTFSEADNTIEKERSRKLIEVKRDRLKLIQAMFESNVVEICKGGDAASSNLDKLKGSIVKMRKLWDVEGQRAQIDCNQKQKILQEKRTAIGSIQQEIITVKKEVSSSQKQLIQPHSKSIEQLESKKQNIVAQHAALKAKADETLQRAVNMVHSFAEDSITRFGTGQLQAVRDKIENVRKAYLPKDQPIAPSQPTAEMRLQTRVQYLEKTCEKKDATILEQAKLIEELMRKNALLEREKAQLAHPAEKASTSIGEERKSIEKWFESTLEKLNPETNQRRITNAVKLGKIYKAILAFQTKQSVKNRNALVSACDLRDIKTTGSHHQKDYIGEDGNTLPGTHLTLLDKELCEDAVKDLMLAVDKIIDDLLKM